MKNKILLGTGLGLVVILVIAVIVAGFFLGDVVKAGMEKIGPKVTQTSLTVGSVQVGILTGSGGVTGLVLGNPEGYKSPTAISIGKAAVSVAPGSLLSDKIVIKSVEMRSPEITFEGNPFGANNLKKIMASVNAFAGGAEAKAATTNAPAPAGAKKPAKKLEVDDFLIRGAKVHASITGIPGVAVKEITVAIPDIHFTGLGQGPDGITAAELTQKVLQEISAATLKAVGDNARNIVDGAANNLISGVATNGTKAVGAGLDTVKKGLGGLFRK
jgi:hypothetical protein